MRIDERSHDTTDRVRDALFAPPTPEELKRRQEVVARTLVNRESRVITPLTTADLVAQARDEDVWYGERH